MGIVSQYRRYEVWRRVFGERLPSFSQGELCFTFHVNKDGKVRYEDISRKNNPYIPMILPRIYRITADRDLRQLQNDLLMFQEDRQLRKLRSGSCIFDPAKACATASAVSASSTRKSPQSFPPWRLPGSWNIRSTAEFQQLFQKAQ